MKSRNIDNNNIKDVENYDCFVDEIDTFAVSKFLNQKNIILVPNLTYNPRATFLPKNCIADGSVALLKVKNNILETKKIKRQSRYKKLLEKRKIKKIKRQSRYKKLLEKRKIKKIKRQSRYKKLLEKRKIKKSIYLRIKKVKYKNIYLP